MSSEISNELVTERQLVTFLLGDDEFGADIMDVKEIIRVPDITKVPNAPSYVEGACNLRGNVLPIINGRTRFQLERKEKDTNSRVLVIDVEGKATGVVVDKVSEVIRVRNSDIDEAPQVIKNIDTDYLNGVVKLDKGNRLIMLLDIVKALRLNQKEKELITDQQVHSKGKSMMNQSKESLEEEQLVSFLLGKEEYAVNIMRVKEIIRVPQIVKVPSCDTYIEGVVSIRNQLLPMINLRTYFDMEPMEVNDQMRILVVDMGAFTAGIIVDKVSEVLRVPISTIQAPPKFSSQSVDELKGIAKLNNGNRMILILDPTKLISMDQMEALNGMNETEGMDDMENKTVQLIDEEKLVTFKLDQEEYGIQISNVQEINRMTEITRIPRAPHHIEGIVNLRGNIIPALDLRKLFGLIDKEATDSTRIIIVDSQGKRTGIVVDSVSEVITFERNLIEETPEILSNGIESDYFEGVAKLDNGKRMIMILNLGKILAMN